VELLPLWLAPNMVTLLGFFFILTNVICLEIFMPDLVGPVRQANSVSCGEHTDQFCTTGAIVVVLQLCTGTLDVFDNGQRGREAGTTNGHI